MSESTKFSRRDALAVAGVVAASSSLKSVVAQGSTNAQGNTKNQAGQTIELSESNVTFRSGTTEMKAFRAEPKRAADDKTLRPALIIIHEIWGLSEHIRDVSRRFAREGYLVLAPDLFTREGPPTFEPSNRAALMEFLASIPDRRMVADLEAAIEYLKENGAGKIGSLGFCMGGLYSYLLATKSTRLNAAVDFYGRIIYPQTSPNKPESPIDLSAQLKCPLLAFFGESDASIPVKDVEALREKLKDAKQPWRINIYPEAGHAFFNNTRPSYNEKAARDAWSETLDFLQQNLK